MGERSRSLPRWTLAAAAVAAVVVIASMTWAARSAGAPAGPAGPDADVVGTRWRAVTVSGRAVVATDAGEVPWLQFDRDAGLRGGDPCNGFRTGYTLAGNRFAVDDVVVTEMACGGADVTAQQGRFLAALTGAARLDRDGDLLTLRSAAGATLATLSRAPYVPPAPVQPDPSTDPDTVVSSGTGG